MELRQRHELNPDAAGEAYPQQLLVLHGRAKGTLDQTIDWSSGKTLAVEWTPSVASTGIGSTAVSIVGVMSAKDGIVQASDGTNVSPIPATYGIGDQQTYILRVDDDGTMIIGRIDDE